MASTLLKFLSRQLNGTQPNVEPVLRNVSCVLIHSSSFVLLNFDNGKSDRTSSSPIENIITFQSVHFKKKSTIYSYIKPYCVRDLPRATGADSRIYHGVLVYGGRYLSRQGMCWHLLFTMV
jgi:hypothetical protein